MGGALLNGDVKERCNPRGRGPSLVPAYCRKSLFPCLGPILMEIVIVSPNFKEPTNEKKDIPTQIHIISGSAERRWRENANVIFSSVSSTLVVSS